MEKDNIKVSICCITFNQEEYIRDALDSFLSQKTNFRYEILVHDDASTDNTVNILKEYKEKYPDLIKLILQEENQYSKGEKILPKLINIACGKYIAICEGDDYWTDKNKLQMQVDYMEKNKECTLCFHSHDEVDKNKNKIRTVKRYIENTICTSSIILGGGGFCATASLMIPTKIMKDLPEYYYNCSVGDYPIQLYAMSKGYAFYINKSMCVYRINSNGSWTSKFKTGDKEYIRLTHTKHFEDLINMLKSFDKNSNYKYSDIVNKQITTFKIEKYLLNEDYTIFRDKSTRDYLKRLDNKVAFIYLFRGYFPKTSYKLKLIRDWIIGV